jgi:acyl carrier protein
VSFESFQQTATDLVNNILKVFGLQMSNSVEMNTPLNELGMDSLMSMELRLILEYGFNIKLSVQELRKTTINNLKKLFDNGKPPAK